MPVARWPGSSQTLPVGRAAGVGRRDPFQCRRRYAAADEDVLEGCDNVDDGAGLELPEESLGAMAHVVRGGAGIQYRVVPDASVVRTEVADVDKCSDALGETRLRDTQADGHQVGEVTSRIAFDALGEGPE